ncbi:MAG TPA: hypothetical protein DD979_10330 [Gammaproteobacteria bacterium]|nr:hypothetical protein [Gammaproteobacteria bacterium]
MTRCLVLLLACLMCLSCGDSGDQRTPIHEQWPSTLHPDPLDSAFEPAAEEDWVTYRADVYRSGQAPGATVGDRVMLAWHRPGFLRGDWTAVKPSGATWGDTLFYPDDMGTLYALNRFDGSERWLAKMADVNPGIHGSPQITSATACIGTYATDAIHCFERETGTQRWRFSVGTAVASAPLYVPEHDAFYTSHEDYDSSEKHGLGVVTKNDPRTGEMLWISKEIGDFPHSSVAVDPDRGIVVVGANDGILRAFDSESGRTLWERDFAPIGGLNDDIKATPAISPSAGLVVIGTWDHRVYAVDIRTGEQRWQFDTGGAMQGSPAIDEARGVVYQGTGSLGESVFALDLATGEKRWGVVAGWIQSSPAISGDGSRIVLGSNDQHVYALNTADGSVAWRFKTDGAVNATPILVEDWVYVAARLGSLYALQSWTP